MRRKNVDIEKEPIRARDIITNLSFARTALAKLKNKGKEYDPLIDTITAIGEDDPIPASKDLQVRFSISPAKLRKWIDTLYEDFLGAIRTDSTVIQFTRLEHRICIYGSRGFISFLCQLPVIPRIGEEIDVPFIAAYTTGSGGSYYVYDIRYEFGDSEMTVNIWARQGFYNKHFEYLKDRADFEGQLSKVESFDMTEYDIEKELKAWYR
ncbi:hypothetical protein GCM10028808_40110 [Spirosoma migulaei]